MFQTHLKNGLKYIDNINYLLIDFVVNMHYCMLSKPAFLGLSDILLLQCILSCLLNTRVADPDPGWFSRIRIRFSNYGRIRIRIWFSKYGRIRLRSECRGLKSL